MIYREKSVHTPVFLTFKTPTQLIQFQNGKREEISLFPAETMLGIMQNNKIHDPWWRTVVIWYSW